MAGPSLKPNVVTERFAISPTGTSTSPFSLKGLIVGAALSLLIGISAPYTMLVVQGSFMAKNSSEPGAIFLFFILVFVINVAVGFLHRRFELSKADLILIYVMLLLAITVPTQPFMGLLIPVISSILYYASPDVSYECTTAQPKNRHCHRSSAGHRLRHRPALCRRRRKSCDPRRGLRCSTASGG